MTTTTQSTLPAREAGVSTAHDDRALDAPTATTGRGAVLAIARVLLGFVFLWAFLDATFGLYATPPSESWLAGVSPTAGYLGSIEGPFAGLFHAMAGLAWVDWAFMLGMGLVGTALILGVAMRLAAVGAIALMVPLWLSSLPLDHNPVVDQHLVYAATAVVLAAMHAGRAFGAGRVWESLPIVRRSSWLR